MFWRQLWASPTRISGGGNVPYAYGRLSTEFKVYWDVLTGCIFILPGWLVVQCGPVNRRFFSSSAWFRGVCLQSSSTAVRQVIVSASISDSLPFAIITIQVSWVLVHLTLGWRGHSLKRSYSPPTIVFHVLAVYLEVCLNDCKSLTATFMFT